MSRLAATFQAWRQDRLLGMVVRNSGHLFSGNTIGTVLSLVQSIFAAKLLGVRQPHVSDLVRYRLNRFSVERLMDFLTVLGKDVQIRVTARPTGRRRAAVQVHHVG